MQFRILGTVEVVDDDGLTLELGGPRERALLARLLLSANRVVPAEVVAEDLWAGDPPPGCLATLRVYVSRLRRALGPAAAAVVTLPPGYRLNVARRDLDASRFAELAATGRADLSSGQPEAAAARLTQALELWRGAALCDVADLAFAQADVTRLEEGRLAVLEDRVEADLRCGRHATVAGELDGLVVVHPLRERLWAQRILALYRCGRQADALRAYQEVRVKLSEELGIDPSPELRRLEGLVLRQDRELDWRPPASTVPAAHRSVELHRGPVTVLYTDFEPESSALLSTVISAHGGSLVRTEGTEGKGAFSFSTFDSPSDAVVAAGELQRRLSTETWSDGRPPPIRVAIHTGAVEERYGDYTGAVVNRAARLASIAHAGQVIMSQATAELVHERLDADEALRYLGVHHLEGLLRPERVHQLVQPGVPAEFPPLRSVDAAGANLPAETTSFVGRVTELAVIAELLGLSRLVTLTGPAGSGKSRLALRAGAQASAHCPDGVWLVQLAGLASPDLLVPAVAAVLAVSGVPNRPLLDSVTVRLADCEAMLILDNCEHVLDAVAVVATAVLGQCQTVRLLATSQIRLGAAGEATWPVPPLTLPSPTERDPKIVGEAEAVRLFCDRAALARPSFALTPNNAATVGEICHRLDGIPLAVELAAARLNTLTPAQLASRLDDRFRVLTGGGRASLPRHRTLRAALEWSHGLLGGPEQRCFRRIAVFAGGCTLDAVERVCPDGGADADTMLETVSSLVDRSLLTAEERCGSMRYGMLESVHHFSHERLEEAGEDATVTRRHLEWLVELIDRADLEGPDVAAWLDVLEAEHDNFRAGLQRALAGADAAFALALAGGLALFWRARGHFAEGRQWLDAALRVASRDEDRRLRARALDGAGLLATVQADYTAQARYQQESLAIWRALDDQAGMARTLVDLGFMAHVQGDYATASARHNEGLAIARRIGDVRRTALALSGLGMVAIHQDDLARSTTYYRESMDCFGEVGDLRRATLILGNLGVVARNQGEFELARDRLSEHLSNARKLGDRKLEAGALTNLGTVAQDLGDLERAARLHQEALALTEQLGDRRISSVALTNLGLVAQAQKDYPAARNFHRRSLAIAESLGEPRSIAEGVEELGRVEAAQGHLERAAKLLGASQALREAIGAPIPGPDVPRFEQAADSVRAALGAERFAQAWTEGRALTVREAVALAVAGSLTVSG